MKRLILLAAALLASFSLPAKDYTVSSPDKGLTVRIQSGEHLLWSLQAGQVQLLAPSEIALWKADGTALGPGARFRKARLQHVDKVEKAQCFKRSEVRNCYNELTLPTRDFDLVVRVYNDGAAYRFVLHRAFTLADETAQFRFPEDAWAWIPYARPDEGFEDPMFNSFENIYVHTPLRAWEKGRLAFLPITVDAPEGMKLCITEADLFNYPGMFLRGADGELEGVFARYPRDIEQGAHNMLQGIVRSREDYIYKGEGPQELPWRAVIVSRQDKELAQSDFVWRLAKPAQGDFSWVKPGKVAWDWWNDWNLKGVDFPAGINNDTYKYYIDFAARSGIEYVILDEGWAVNLQADLFQVVPEIDLEMLCQYAKERGVGLVLWAGYWAFNKDMEAVCAHYAKMGIAGWKIDFMDRDDQPMVQFYERAARTAAQYHQFIDFHGAFKPTGNTRPWPNVLNHEGVAGLEQMKWAPATWDQVTYDVTIPFVRLVAGPADYTQGAMRNAAPGNFAAIWGEPMSQGTRCRQLAEYIIFDAPFTMLCDAPTSYEQEPECTQLIASFPTVWEETVALAGSIGEYVAIARRAAGHWYIAALTNWDARELTLQLPEGIARGTSATLWRDGVNAHRNGQDYKKETVTLQGGTITVSLAPGGGCVLVL